MSNEARPIGNPARSAVDSAPPRPFRQNAKESMFAFSRRFPNDDLGLLPILSVWWRYKFFVAFIVALTLAGSILAYVYISPVYEASTVLLVGPNSIDDSGQNSNKMQMTVRSQAQIAESVDVVKAALLDIGLQNVPPVQPSPFKGLGAKIRQMVKREKDADPPIEIANVDVMTEDYGRMVRVRTEPNSESLIISFRNGDPRFAAKFADALAWAFISRQAQLMEHPETVDFYRAQKDNFENEVNRNTKLFDDFVKKQSTYSIAVQLGLQLKRENDLATQLGQTRGSIAEKLGQKEALVSQLKLLKPVTQSSYVVGLVDKLGENTGNSLDTLKKPSSLPSGGDLPRDPPLLMIKVYQDAMVELLKVNGEIAGFGELQHQQENELSENKKVLAALIQHQAEYNRLKRNLDLAVYNVNLLSKRTVDVQITENLRQARLLTARVVQQATVPLRAVFPNGQIFVGGGTALGLVLGIMLALMREQRKRHAKMVS